MTSISTTATSLLFFYQSPSGYQCGVLRSTTFSLYADAAHTSLVKSLTLPAGTQTGAHVFSGLTPSTDYYVVASLDAAGVPTNALPVTRTKEGTTATTTSTTFRICDWGGPAPVTPVRSTTNSVTYTWSYSAGGYVCGQLAVGATVTVFADAALTQVVTTWTTPRGGTAGAYLLGGLSPGTTYYGRSATTAPFGTIVSVEPFTTASVNTATTTTTSSIYCDPPPAQASLDSATATSLTFAFESVGAVGCSGTAKGVTTIEVYSDAARTVRVGRAASEGGVRAGLLTVSGLQPNTTYYPSVRLDTSPFGSPTMPAVKTLPTTTTCQPVGIGPPSSKTATSITWSLSSALCATSLTATVYLSQSDATALVNPVTSASVNLPAPSITVSGLRSHVEYWVRFSGGFGLQGPLYTLASTTTTTLACDPLPASATFVSATISSLVFSFSSPAATGCGGGVTTITVYRDAAHTSVAGSASSVRGATSGTLEVRGLAPGTIYYPAVRLDTSPFSSPAMPRVMTQPFGMSTSTTSWTTTSAKACTATWQTLSAWPGGFLGQVTVRNSSAAAASSWQVGWTWSGSSRLTASYHATLGGTASSPTLTALDWNRVIQAGGSTTVQVQGTATGPLTAPVIACALT